MNANINNEALHQRKDNSYPVPNASLYPYNCIVRIKAHYSKAIRVLQYAHKNFSQSNVKLGIANFIAPLILITSGHVIYSRQIRQRAIKVEVIICNQQSATTKIINLKVEELIVHEQYINNKSQNDGQRFDIALLKVATTHELKLGMFLRIKTDYKFSIHRPIKIVSYRSNNVDGFHLVQEDGTPVNQRFCILKYHHTTFPGDSGAPVFVQQGNTFYLIGLHKGSYANENCCVLLSSLMKNTKDILGEMIETHMMTKYFSQNQNYQPSSQQLYKQFIEYSNLKIKNSMATKSMKQTRQLLQRKQKELEIFKNEDKTNQHIQIVERELFECKERAVRMQQQWRQKESKLERAVEHLHGVNQQLEQKLKHLQNTQSKLIQQSQSLQFDLEIMKTKQILQQEHLNSYQSTINLGNRKVQKQNNRIFNYEQLGSRTILVENNQEGNENSNHKQKWINNNQYNVNRQLHHNEKVNTQKRYHYDNGIMSQQRGNMPMQRDNISQKRDNISQKRYNMSQQRDNMSQQRDNNLLNNGDYKLPKKSGILVQERDCAEKANDFIQRIYRFFSNSPVLPITQPISMPVASRIINPQNTFQYVMSVIQSNFGQRYTVQRLQTQMNKRLVQSRFQGYLILSNLKFRMEELVTYNWFNVVKLQLNDCSLEDHQWQVLTQNMHAFPHLEILEICTNLLSNQGNNKIRSVTIGQLLNIKHLKQIWFKNGFGTKNNLSKESIAIMHQFWKNKQKLPFSMISAREQSEIRDLYGGCYKREIR